MSTIAFILSHTPQAVLMAGLFALGGAAAGAALRWRIEALLAMPRVFARALGRLFNSRLAWPLLALAIFLFNGAAVFLYMLSGLIPWGVHAVAILTGLNVVAGGILAREIVPTPPAPPSPLAQFCVGATFLLELPCFWYSLAMGATLETSGTAGLGARIEAYLAVVLPLLALSALAEGYAVSRALPPRDVNGTPP